MKRRDFIKTTAAVGVAALTFDKLQAAITSNKLTVEAAPYMVAVMGGEPAQLLERALKEMGGIEKYVKNGSRVRSPGIAAAACWEKFDASVALAMLVIITYKIQNLALFK